MSIKKITASSILLGLTACGKFNYNAPEFTRVNDAAKKLEDLNEESVMNALDSLAEEKIAPINTKDFRDQLTRVITAMMGSVASPLSLTDGNGFSLAGVPSSADPNAVRRFLNRYVYNNPCKSYKVAETSQAADAIFNCRPSEYAKYSSMIRNLLVETRQVFSDASKIIYFLLEEKTSKGQPYDFKGSVVSDIEPPARILGFIPKEYQSYKIDLAALEVGNDEAKKLHIRVKDTANNPATSVADLTTIKSDFTSTSYANDYANYKYNYLARVKGKSVKLSGANDSSVVEVYLGINTDKTKSYLTDDFKVMIKVSNIDCQSDNPTIGNDVVYTMLKDANSNIVYSKAAVRSHRLNSKACNDTVADGDTSKGVIFVDAVQAGTTSSSSTDNSVSGNAADKFAMAFSYGAESLSVATGLSTVAAAGGQAFSSLTSIRGTTNPNSGDLACVTATSKYGYDKDGVNAMAGDKAFWIVALDPTVGGFKSRASDNSAVSNEKYTRCGLEYSSTAANKITWSSFLNLTGSTTVKTYFDSLSSITVPSAAISAIQ